MDGQEELIQGWGSAEDLEMGKVPHPGRVNAGGTGQSLQSVGQPQRDSLKQLKDSFFFNQAIPAILFSRGFTCSTFLLAVTAVLQRGS